MTSGILAVALQEDTGVGVLGAVAGLGFMLLWLAFVLLIVVSLWKVFTKAGEPGWACLIPIYNIVVLLKIAGKPVWWILLMLIPLVNFVVAIIVSIGVAERFGKSTGFGIGLALLSPIFYPILAFGDARYQG
jgi:hypothetical protein